MKRTMLVMAMVIALAMSTMVMALASSSMGNEVKDRALMDTTWTNWWIVDTNNPADAIGTVESIDYYARTTNQLKFFLVDEDKEVTWVSGLITPPATGPQTYVLDTPMGVGVGDNIGIYFAQTGTIPFDNTGTTYLDDRNGSGEPAQGQTLEGLGSRDRTYSVNATIIPAPKLTKDSCKDGGWETNFPVETYRNQGQCVSEFARAAK